MSTNGKEAVRLCEHVIREAFGNVICRIASTLLNRGRLPIGSLAHLSGTSRPFTLSSLVILMQHHLVQSSGGGFKGLDEEEYFEFNISECLLRLRWGRIMATTKEKLGDEALDIVRKLMIYGRLTLPHVIHACVAVTNQQAALVKATLITMVQNHLLIPTHPSLCVLLADEIDREFKTKRREKMSQSGGILTATELSNLREQTAHSIKETREKKRSIDRVLTKTEKAGKKKKGKSVEEYDYDLRNDVPLRINYDRYGVIWRDELLVRAAVDRWNQGAAEVVKAILAVSLDDDSELANERTMTAVGLNEIVAKIPSTMANVLSAGMIGGSSSNVPELVRKYLAVMAADDVSGAPNAPFLSKDDSSNPTYTVTIEAICIKMRVNLMMELVRERHGDRTARVLATIAKAHKIGEQMVRNCAMMPLREARTALAELQKLGLIETSEIPKNPNLKRQTMTATSEHHHWGIDLPRAYNVLLASVYKALSNILQRKGDEVEKRSAALAKLDVAIAKHVDVTALITRDREDIAELQDTEKKLGLALVRCEEVVFILRDMPGWPTRRTLG